MALKHMKRWPINYKGIEDQTTVRYHFPQMMWGKHEKLGYYQVLARMKSDKRSYTLLVSV